MAYERRTMRGPLFQVKDEAMADDHSGDENDGSPLPLQQWELPTSTSATIPLQRRQSSTLTSAGGLSNRSLTTSSPPLPRTGSGSGASPRSESLGERPQTSRKPLARAVGVHKGAPHRGWGWVALGAVGRFGKRVGSAWRGSRGSCSVGSCT